METRIWAERKLMAAVHWDALRMDPRAYLTAAWWRLCRKKVRARHQFTTLFGRTRFAYDLWVVRTRSRTSDAAHDHAKIPLVALVDTSAQSDCLKETLRDLAEQGIAAWQIDAPSALAKAAQAIDWSAQPWLMLVSSGDRLDPATAAVYRNAIVQAPDRTRIVYADDDLIDLEGRRSTPHFKPDWNGELFRHFDFLTGACAVKATHKDLEACSDGHNWAATLVERVAGSATPIHVPRMLHHRAGRSCPRVPAVPTIPDESLPSVSIIVPTRNRVDLLRTCISGIAQTNYPDIEVIVVDNDSDDPATLTYLAELDPARYRVLRHAGSFNFSALNNRAAAVARGRLLCLLNNDIEVVSADWLRIMAIQALRPEVGAVGARLDYPDGRIQHAGVVIGLGNAAGHAHRFLLPNNEGYFRRHTLPQYATAVTAACLVVERDRFLAVGGLDERNFAVAFNDVDLCLRLNQHGWQSLYEPRAVLIHHESVSRGFDRDPAGRARFAKELAALQRLWNTDTAVDPFHHEELSRASEQFVVQLQDEA